MSVDLPCAHRKALARSGAKNVRADAIGNSQNSIFSNIHIARYCKAFVTPWRGVVAHIAALFLGKKCRSRPYA
eukprot:Skav210336  [mRNA]  locus=scaffold4443:95714:95932:+ [translate_table: standard]